LVINIALWNVNYKPFGLPQQLWSRPILHRQQRGNENVFPNKMRGDREIGGSFIFFMLIKGIVQQWLLPFPKCCGGA